MKLAVVLALIGLSLGLGVLVHLFVQARRRQGRRVPDAWTPNAPPQRNPGPVRDTPGCMVQPPRPWPKPPAPPVGRRVPSHGRIIEPRPLPVAPARDSDDTFALAAGAFIGMDLASGPDRTVTFDGHGGSFGGAGASSTWDDAKPDTTPTDTGSSDSGGDSSSSDSGSSDA